MRTQLLLATLLLVGCSGQSPSTRPKATIILIDNSSNDEILVNGIHEKELELLRDQAERVFKALKLKPGESRLRVEVFSRTLRNTFDRNRSNKDEFMSMMERDVQVSNERGSNYAQAIRYATGFAKANPNQDVTIWFLGDGGQDAVDGDNEKTFTTAARLLEATPNVKRIHWFAVDSRHRQQIISAFGEGSTKLNMLNAESRIAR